MRPADSKVHLKSTGLTLNRLDACDELTIDSQTHELSKYLKQETWTRHTFFYAQCASTSEKEKEKDDDYGFLRPMHSSLHFSHPTVHEISPGSFMSSLCRAQLRVSRVTRAQPRVVVSFFSSWQFYRRHHDLTSFRTAVATCGGGGGGAGDGKESTLTVDDKSHLPPTRHDEITPRREAARRGERLFHVSLLTARTE